MSKIRYLQFIEFYSKAMSIHEIWVKIYIIRYINSALSYSITEVTLVLGLVWSKRLHEIFANYWVIYSKAK